jgi:hypothetical protein
MREDGSAIYILSGGGGRSDWVRNIARNPGVSIRFGARDAPGQPARAREATTPEEDDEARRLLLEKYGVRYSGDLSRWGRTALPIVIQPVS